MSKKPQKKQISKRKKIEVIVKDGDNITSNKRNNYFLFAILLLFASIVTAAYNYKPTVTNTGIRINPPITELKPIQESPAITVQPIAPVELPKIKSEELPKLELIPEKIYFVDPIIPEEPIKVTEIKETTIPVIHVKKKVIKKRKHKLVNYGIEIGKEPTKIIKKKCKIRKHKNHNFTPAELVRRSLQNLH